MKPNNPPLKHRMPRLLVAAFAIALTSIPHAQAAGKGGGNSGGDDGGSGGPACVLFADDSSHLIQSDWFKSPNAEPGANPYCHDKRTKVAVTIGNDGSFDFETQSSNKAVPDGRTLYVSFADCAGECTLPSWFVEVGAITSEDLEVNGLVTKARLRMPSSNFSLLGMEIGTTRTHVNLSINLSSWTANGQGAGGVTILFGDHWHQKDASWPAGDFVEVTRLDDANWLVVIPDDAQAAAFNPGAEPDIFYGHLRMPGAFLIIKQ